MKWTNASTYFTKSYFTFVECIRYYVPLSFVRESGLVLLSLSSSFFFFFFLLAVSSAHANGFEPELYPFLPNLSQTQGRADHKEE